MKMLPINAESATSACVGYVVKSCSTMWTTDEVDSRFRKDRNSSNWSQILWNSLLQSPSYSWLSTEFFAGSQQIPSSALNKVLHWFSTEFFTGSQQNSSLVLFLGFILISFTDDWLVSYDTGAMEGLWLWLGTVETILLVWGSMPHDGDNDFSEFESYVFLSCCNAALLWAAAGYYFFGFGSSFNLVSCDRIIYYVGEWLNVHVVNCNRLCTD